MKKDYVISVRLTQEMGKYFEQIAKVWGLHKSEFLTACIKKLIFDNNFYLSNYHKSDKVIKQVKQELKEVDTKHIVVINGSIDDATDIAILMFCDYLFAFSKEFWESVKISCKEWFTSEFEEYYFKEYTKLNLFEIQDISCINVPGLKQIPAEDLVSGEVWADTFETKKIMLIMGMEYFLKKYDLEKIIKKILNDIEKEFGSKQVLIIDSKGNFKRGRNSIYGPVYANPRSSLRDIL
jgi:hypothetical protein